LQQHIEVGGSVVFSTCMRYGLIDDLEIRTGGSARGLGAGLGGLGGRAVADEQKGDVVRLTGPARKALDGIDHSLLELIEGGIMVAGDGLGEAGNAEHLILGVGGLGNTVAEQDQGVAGLESLANGGVIGIGHQPHGKGALGKDFTGLSSAKKQR